ncbi:alkaline phosphatase family protein [Litchfieldia alkalitelluris]|uniref:alkaline phosphatase family protein n=1 Tax=Litchfieldia alkalitelluris TaxID=304268 RepID=UPI000997B751|nr:ectonucleotide pyrophosphatase/phosphodiesterase [Litchfieldia alkalitelluris]
MSRLTEHLIVISFDCFSSLDLPLVEDLPHFKNLLKTASLCKRVQTIYPSVTYPCHTTIVTGKYPKNHGVINNTFLQPGSSSPDWFWHRSHIKGTTLYDEAKKGGMKTAALLWPVTAKAKIDYNMPEIFANRFYHHQIPVSLANGSSLFQLEMNYRFGSMRNGLKQPELDDFVLESTVHTIKTRKPDLLLVHFTDLDTQRHYHGFSSEQATQALHRHDTRLGRIQQALFEAGISENSTIVVLGDHSALDETKAIQLNVLLKENGFITMGGNNKVIDWKAYCKSCDGSAYIYLKDRHDKGTFDSVSKLLEELLKSKEHGIESILTGLEISNTGADDQASFMLEASRGYYFKENVAGELIHVITDQEVREKKYTFASHGYSPQKEDYTTVFIASGKGIQPQLKISSMHLVDEGPTLARLLGLHLGSTDGRVVDELLTL